MHTILLHDFVERSVANGPGVRSVIWTQGCNLGCVGCINPATHRPLSAQPESLVSVDELLLRIPDDVDGVTLSGGEPFQQRLESIYYLITKVHEMDKTVTLFTGYSPMELLAMSPTAIDIFKECDLMIAGRYLHHLPPTKGLPLIASDNQVLLFPTGRYSLEDLNSVAKLEILFDIEEGRNIKTGVNKEPKK